MINQLFYQITLWLLVIFGYVWGVRLMDFYEIFAGMAFASVISFLLHNYLDVGVIREPKENMYPALATWHEDGHIHAIVPENIDESFDTSIAIARMKLGKIRKVSLDKRKTITMADTKRAKKILWILLLVSLVSAVFGILAAWHVLPPEWEIPVPTPNIPK